MWTWLLGRLMSLLEWPFPLVRTLPIAEVEACGGTWVPPVEYYMLDDPRPFWGKRLRAVLTLNKSQVSFWKKRQRLLNLGGVDLFAYRKPVGAPINQLANLANDMTTNYPGFKAFFDGANQPTGTD